MANDHFLRPDDPATVDPDEHLADDTALEYEFVVDDEDEPQPVGGALRLTPPD